MFSAIRNQIVCIDDLERRGSISVKDVLGLISYLREQRACKVVLLLNRTQLDEPGKKEFDDFFEKVIDTQLVFEPTSAEAVAIALDGSDELSKLIREYCEKLDIANIRVIKKIERLVWMLDEPVLSNCGSEIRRQIIQSMVLLAWRKLDVGANPPTISYLHREDYDRYLKNSDDEFGEMSDSNPEHQRWDVILEGYGWGSMDELDEALLNFVETSVLDADAIVEKAKVVAARLSERKQMAALDQSWRPLHSSFNDNEVCKSIIEGVKNNFAMVSRPNLDVAVCILRELGRAKDADDLIDLAVRKTKPEFWSYDDPFHRQVKDSRIKLLVQDARKAVGSVFDFREYLLSAAKTLDRDQLAQLAAVQVETYQLLFEASTGDELNNYVYAAFEYRKIGNATDDMKRVVAQAEEALRRIAKKSKLNEIRVRKYNVTLDSRESDTA